MSVILFDQTSYNNFPIFCLRCDWFNVWFLSRPEIIFSLFPLWSRRTLRKSSKEPTRWVYILFLSSLAYYLTLSRAFLNIYSPLQIIMLSGYTKMNLAKVDSKQLFSLSMALQMIDCLLLIHKCLIWNTLFKLEGCIFCVFFHLIPS